MRRLVRRSGASHRLRTTGEGGFTLLEAVLVVLVSSVGILAVALGLLSAISIDGRTNRQQRLNVASTTILDQLERTPPQTPTCPEVSSPAPRSDQSALGANTSAAAKYLRSALSAPQVQQWVDRGVVFSVTRLNYWASTGVSRGDGCVGPDNIEQSLKVCSTNDYDYPVARLEILACWSGDGEDGCDPKNSRIVGAASVRGPR